MVHMYAVLAENPHWIMHRNVCKINIVGKFHFFSLKLYSVHMCNDERRKKHFIMDEDKNLLFTSRLKENNRKCNLFFSCFRHSFIPISNMLVSTFHYFSVTCASQSKQGQWHTFFYVFNIFAIFLVTNLNVVSLTKLFISNFYILELNYFKVST